MFLRSLTIASVAIALIVCFDGLSGGLAHGLARAASQSGDALEADAASASDGLRDAASPTLPSDAELLALIRSRVDEGRAKGIVLGVVEADGSHRIVFYGDSGSGSLPVGPESVFEIGSITKVFTAIALADMAARGQLRLDDPVQAHAHTGVTIPTFGDTPITLVDLSTHQSGLPRLPGNLHPADATNPFADYGEDQLHDFLSKHSLVRDVGADYEYSNLAVGLLGHILAKLNGSDWEGLIKQRILDPLGMRMTGVTLTPDMQEHLARGHDESGEPTTSWDMPTLAGAGALRSNVEDMLLFVDANLGDPATPLEEAMRASQAPRLWAPAGMKIGLNWLTRTIEDRQIVWHNGRTGGYASFVGFDPEARTGVVVLANSRHATEDLGFHLFDPSLRLERMEPGPKEVEVSRDVLSEYVGVYQLAPEFELKITLGQSGLYVQATKQTRIRIFAQSETRFSLKGVDAEISFLRNGAGKVAQLILHQGGDQLAQKIQ